MADLEKVYTIHLLGGPKSRPMTPPNSDKMWSNTRTFSFLIGIKMVQPLWRIVWQLFTKLNILILYDPVMALLGICPKKMKTICTQMFITALFIMPKLGSNQDALQ